MRKSSFLDMHQTVGYNPSEEILVVTLTSKMANAMKGNGWDVSFDPELGYFINVKKE